MPSLCVVGMQWGDEGKGKLIDCLSAQADVVVRYQGGSNAGHTVVVDGRKTILHLLPSGILHDGCLCVIGNGVVVDPEELLGEIDALTARGVDFGSAGASPSRLLISDRAQVVMPYHKALDEASEAAKGAAKLGTTLRGIGPCYVDKVSRCGIRMVDLIRPAALEARLRANLDATNKVLTGVYGREPLSLQPMLDAAVAFGQRLRPHVADTVTFLHRALAEGRKMLFEGAQGALLDLDFGTYPYLTSSNASVCGIPAGTGVPPSRLTSVLGVVKAYTTRVGAGPFPTEMHGPLGDRVREDGGEYGSTTGRARRCGWLDAVALRYAVGINGTTGVAITKLDVLDRQPVLRICTAYRHEGRLHDTFPSDLETLEQCEPQYEEMPGWQSPTPQATRLDDLPPAAQSYLRRIHDLLGVPVQIVSVGNDRSQTIFAAEGDLFC
jgi:adenylosuccinate synthase